MKRIAVAILFLTTSVQAECPSEELIGVHLNEILDRIDTKSPEPIHINDQYYHVEQHDTFKAFPHEMGGRVNSQEIYRYKEGKANECRYRIRNAKGQRNIILKPATPAGTEKK